MAFRHHALLIALVACLGGVAPAQAADAAPAVSKAASSSAPLPAPPFSLPALDARGDTSLEHYRGSWLYLDFWASWCGPCRRSFPYMTQLRQKWPQLRVLAISVDSDAAAAQEFLQQVPARGFDVALDLNGKIAAGYRLQGMPSSFLIDPQGNIVHRHAGFNQASMDKVEAELQQIFGARP